MCINSYHTLFQSNKEQFPGDFSPPVFTRSSPHDLEVSGVELEVTPGVLEVMEADCSANGLWALHIISGSVVKVGMTIT